MCNLVPCVQWQYGPLHPFSACASTPQNLRLGHTLLFARAARYGHGGGLCVSTEYGATNRHLCSMLERQATAPTRRWSKRKRGIYVCNFPLSSLARVLTLKVPPGEVRPHAHWSLLLAADLPIGGRPSSAEYVDSVCRHQPPHPA